MINRIRVPLGFLVAAAVLYFATPSGRSILAGMPIAGTGLLFRLLAAGTIRKDAQLATSGPYSLTRNPLYFGSFLIAAGFAVMSANLIAAAFLMGPSAVIYPVVIRNEERHLDNLFKERFRSYKLTIPVFFPRFGLPGMESFSFSQYLANKEYNVALGFAASLAVLVLKWLDRQ
jgi:protein-S-isoprenylcysteine O-methyltransferase Ste14